MEAELYSENCKSETKIPNDYTKFISYIHLNAETIIPFDFHGENNKLNSIKFWIKCKEPKSTVNIFVDEIKIGEIKINKMEEFISYSLNVEEKDLILKNVKHHLKIMTENNSILLDKIELNMK